MTSRFLDGFTYFMIEEGKGIAVGLYRGHHRVYLVSTDSVSGQFVYENAAVIPDAATAIKVTDFLHDLFGTDEEDDFNATRH